MNDDGRGFSPCENQAAVAGPLEVIRGRERRLFFPSPWAGLRVRAAAAAGAAGAVPALATIFPAAFPFGMRSAGLGGLTATTVLAGANFLASVSVFAGFPAGLIDAFFFCGFALAVCFAVRFTAGFTRFFATREVGFGTFFARFAAVLLRALVAAFFPCTFAMSSPAETLGLKMNGAV